MENMKYTFITALLTIIMGFILILLTSIIFGALTGVFVYWLWNWLLPPIFGFHEITWIQAWGLMVLSSLLFKSNSVSSESK